MSIRGHGIGTLYQRDAGHITIDCACRLLPGRPYVLHGVSADGGSCRMRVVSASVRSLRGESGVGYRVTFQAEPPTAHAGTRFPVIPLKSG